METRLVPAGKSIVMITATSAELAVPRERSIKGGTVPAFQAFRILHWGFVAAPILMGADKFFDLLCNWEQYLAPSLLGLSPLSAAATMRAVGVVEIAAGLIVALKPRIGAWVVAGWLAAIIVNLVLAGGYYDVALRDFGLCLAALALARLSTTFDPRRTRRAI